MFPSSTTSKLTYEDLLQMPEDGLRHEVIDGDHYVTASPSTRHQRIVTRLLVRLHAHLEALGEGEVLPAPTDVVLSDYDIVVPDLLVVFESDSSRLTEAHVRGAPGLAVEILSPSTRGRDLGLKRKLYERVGVREYWIVDPAEETIEVRVLTSGKLESRGAFAAGESLVSELLPALELEVGAVFERPAAAPPKG